MEQLQRLLQIMVTLRDPDSGCAWDRRQSLASLVPHTLEEAYEVADAVERNALDELPDELGDLLFQVVFYAQIAKELGAFDFIDVIETLNAKLVRRHPQVFEDASIQSEHPPVQDWERAKVSERERAGLGGALAGVAANLPSLSRAAKLQKRAAAVGFDWSQPAPVWDKIDEELAELRAVESTPGGSSLREEELGDLLFSVVNLARHLDIDAEAALRRGNRKFERRFRYIETTLAATGDRVESTDAETLDRLWTRAKRQAK